VVNENKVLVEEKKKKLIELTRGFSEHYLNEEYEQVILKMINKLARKRTVPFSSGKIEIWASAVIHAIGTVNFLFDPSQVPHVSVGDICQHFGTNQSTIVQKSKIIRDMFNMTYFDDEFSIVSNEQSNPFNNMVSINGLVVPRDLLR
jgi:hypothetical protein